MTPKIKKYAKAIVGALGILLTVASAWYGPAGTIGQLITLALAAGTTFGIWRVPNTAAAELAGAIDALKAQQVRRHGAKP